MENAEKMHFGVSATHTERQRFRWYDALHSRVLQITESGGEKLDRITKENAGKLTLTTLTPANGIASFWERFLENAFILSRTKNDNL